MTHQSTKAKMLRNTIIKVATAGGSNAGAYVRYRDAIMSECFEFHALIPNFVLECDNVDSLFKQMQGLSPQYSERRKLIHEAFVHLISRLEHSELTENQSKLLKELDLDRYDTVFALFDAAKIVANIDPDWSIVIFYLGTLKVARDVSTALRQDWTSQDGPDQLFERASAGALAVERLSLRPVSQRRLLFRRINASASYVARGYTNWSGTEGNRHRTGPAEQEALEYCDECRALVIVVSHAFKAEPVRARRGDG